MADIIDTINNNFYICQSQEGEYKILSTNYLAKRIGVIPTHTRNGLRNRIVKVYCHPFQSRIMAKNYINEGFRKNHSIWIDIHTSNRLVKCIKSIKFFSAYYLYLINEMEFIFIASEIEIDPIEDLKKIRESAIRGKLIDNTSEIIIKLIKMLSNSNFSEYRHFMILDGMLQDKWFKRKSLTALFPYNKI